MTNTILHSSDLTRLKGVGPKVQERLSKLGLNNIQDVLFHLPFRYEDRTRVVAVGSLRHGQSSLVEVAVDYASVAFTRKGKSRRMLLVHTSDGTGSLLLRFFYFNKQQQQTLVAGTKLRCFGDVRFNGTSVEITHPEYTQIKDHNTVSVENALTPVYPTVDGVSQILLRRLSTQCLALLDEKLLPDYLQNNIYEHAQAYTLAEALKYVHRPPSTADVNKLVQARHKAQWRLIFEELLAQHLSLQLLREKNTEQQAISLESDNHMLYQFIKSLPFELTIAQQKVNQEILQDLESGVPMMRLVQGDVGSGKTIVAALACLKAVESGMQAAIMAPTEILAEQHYKNFTGWFEPLGINVVWLSGQIKGKKRQQVIEKISSGEAQLIVGTHALFQNDIDYKCLALAITDEQHRFGVQQRQALAKKARNIKTHSGAKPVQLAHQLIMTATPIPRSLAMTAYADLDYSVIDELPPGRKPVTTVVIQQERRNEVTQRIYNACSEGRQAYWVCTLVEESESLQCQAAEDTAQVLQQALTDISVGLIHGRMKSDEKEQLMQAFKNAEIQLLVATTVIEVGVDVPNASLMIIENAERLGLSQLHQLRGRVGRGSEASHCVLMFKSPLSKNAKERLTTMRKTNNGFEIARKDLQLRGPGEVLGTRQTGLIQLKIADIVRDEYMLDDVKLAAQKILKQSPEKIKPLVDRWIGVAQQYVNVG